MARIPSRLSIGSALAVFAFVTAGCLQMSINPLFDLSGGRFDDRLVGAWSCREAETWTFEQKQETDHGRTLRYYDVLVKSGDEEGRAIAIFGKIGTHDFITFTAEDEASGVPPFLRRHYRSVFSFGRVELSPNRVAFFLLDGDWVDKNSNAVARGLGQKMFDDSVLLTAPSTALQTFAAANATNAKAFPQTMVLVKAGASGASCYAD